jgi:hypothetical protein
VKGRLYLLVGGVVVAFIGIALVRQNLLTVVNGFGQETWPAGAIGAGLLLVILAFLPESFVKRVSRTSKSDGDNKPTR